MKKAGLMPGLFFFIQRCGFVGKFRNHVVLIEIHDGGFEVVAVAPVIDGVVIL